MKVLIIGGVAGGATAAARIRRLDEKAEIVILERSGFVSYANCGLPYYVGGVITDPGQLTLQTPESFWVRYRIDVRVKSEAISIDPDKKTVRVRKVDTGESYEESYDKLLLSPGAKPVVPDIEGVKSDRVFSLRTVEDTFRIRQFAVEEKPKTAVVIGGGYIGLELAENLREMGIGVTVAQRPAQLMNNLDPDIAAFVRSKMEEKGVTVKLKADVTGFEETASGIKTFIKDEKPLSSDMVIMAVGVRPDTSLAQEAGAATGIKDSIAVNEKMETSLLDIYAVGDGVQIKHRVSGKDAVIALAGPANKQGRIAADNICGGDSRYSGGMGSSVIKIFDMTVAGTGLTEKAVKAAGIEYDKVVLTPLSHAGYYPGATPMVMKVIFEKKTLRLLGAQIAGYEGVDKRIDVLATAIMAGMKADRLGELDLAYAPPYSSAKDPANMAGFMIENIAKGLVKQFHWDQVADLPRDGSVTLLDVRTVFEYGAGHADGFVNIPVDELRERFAEVDKSKPVYVMCHSGLRSYIACRILAQEGYDCYNFSGGYGFYAVVANRTN